MRDTPQDVETEKALLGSMMLSPDSAESCISELSSGDFFRPAHSRIFEAMRSLLSDGRAIEPNTVADRMKSAGTLDESGGYAYLSDVQSAVYVSSNRNEYLGIVKRLSTARQLIDAGTAIATIGYDAPEDGMLTRAEELLGSVADGHSLEHDTLGTVIDRVARSSVEKSSYILLPELDLRLRPGEVCYLAARPKIGKTSLMVQWAHDLAQRHLRSTMYNYEMSNAELGSRVIAMVSGVGRSKLDDGIGESGVDYIEKSTGGKWRDFISTVDKSLTLSQLCLDIRRQARKGSRIAFIDYLQLVVDGSSYEDVTRASRQMKLAAKAAGIPLVVVSQLSRLEPGAKPSPNHLRQSGAMEQDADVVVLMHSYEWPGRDDPDDQQREKMIGKGYLLERDDPRKLGYIQVALHRSGPTYLVPALYDGTEFRWTALNQTADGKRY